MTKKQTNAKERGKVDYDCNVTKKNQSCFYLLKKGNKFAHEVAKDPSREGIERGGEGDAAHQEDDVSGGQVRCTKTKGHGGCLVCGNIT